MTSLFSIAPFFASSLSEQAFQWPTFDLVMRVLTLQDYNTRVVVLGTATLGMAAGLVGSFTLLRRRALMGDALAHATLPGICLAFILASVLGANGKSLPILLLGAAISGLLGVASILAIRRYTKLKEDTALGIVLSVFFGLGTALMALVQQMETGHAAGLESFIYGKTASMIAADAQLILFCAVACLIVCTLMFKELKLLCFDDAFAGSRGYSVLFLDVVLMALVVIVTIVGLQSVGLVLVIALMVIPAASARFWTDKMFSLAFWSVILGAISCLFGAAVSAMMPRLPSGAMIVLVSAFVFAMSMLFGTQRGVIIRALRRRNVNHRNDARHLLRGMYEVIEGDPDVRTPIQHVEKVVTFNELLPLRSWSASRLQRILKSEIKQGYLQKTESGYRLTERGFAEAERLVREHRLWEIYLITHAEVAPSRVDRDADAIEHVLEPELITELERLLMNEVAVSRSVPPDPHGAAVIH